MNLLADVVIAFLSKATGAVEICTNCEGNVVDADEVGWSLQDCRCARCTGCGALLEGQDRGEARCGVASRCGPRTLRVANNTNRST